MNYKGDRYNGENYLDMTAYYAIKNLEKGSCEMKVGEVWEVNTQKSINKCLVLAVHDGYVTEVLLSEEYPTFGSAIEVIFDGKTYYTDCGRLSYAFNNYCERRIGKVTDEQFALVQNGVVEKLKLPKAVETIDMTTVQETSNEDHNKIIRLEVERDIYKNMYKELLEKVIDGDIA